MRLAATVGSKAKLFANIFVPSGTLWIQASAEAEGSFFGRDVRVGTKVELRLNSGWDIPGVIYEGQPAAKIALTKPISIDEEAQAEEIASDLAFGLGQNYPNPFNPSTTIRYTLAEASDVRLVVYNVIGQEVRTLVNAAQPSGAYNVVWDGRDAIGRQVATGMYIYRLVAGENLAVRKMIIAK
jgi:hypothetical protein